MSEIRSSCISSPPQMRRVVIKQEYLGICQGFKYPRCAAALLNMFEHWTNYKLDKMQEEERVIKAAAAKGRVIKPRWSPWIFMSQSDMKEELYGLFGESQIVRSLNALAEAGFIKVRNNPEKKWDRKLQYLLQIRVVQSKINAWASSIECIPYQYDMHDVEVRLALLTSTEAIPQIQTQITDTEQKETSDDVALSAPEQQLSSQTVEEIVETEQPLQVAKAKSSADAEETLTPSSAAPPLSPLESMKNAIIEAMVSAGKWDKTLLTAKPEAASVSKSGKKKRTARDNFYSNLTTVSNTLIGMGIKAAEIASLIQFIHDMAEDLEWTHWTVNVLTGNKSIDHISAWRKAPNGKYASKKKPQQGEDLSRKEEYQPYVPQGIAGKHQQDVENVLTQYFGGN